MKLKTAIYITELSYGFFIILAFLGIVACIMTLRGGSLAIGILTVVILFVVAFLVKLRFINYYLKRCKYPFEFLSVLKQLGLTKDLEVNWSEELANVPVKTYLKTQEFLADNHLAADITSKRHGIFFWMNSRKSQNDYNPIIRFRENGLMLENTRHNWSTIVDWDYIDSDTHAGKIEITFQGDNSERKILLDLEQLNANYIDLMLLFTHFKAKFG
jgi:hypothetical protein